MSSLDALTAVFKIPYKTFELPDPFPRQSTIPPNSMRAMARNIPRRRRLVETDGHLEPPSSGYREYLLFALRTRLTPELKELVGKSVIISFVGHPAPSLRLSLPGGEKEPHINPSLREEIDSLLKRESEIPWHQRLETLLIHWNSVRYMTGSGLKGDGVFSRIPNRWIKSVLPFVPKDYEIRDDMNIPSVEYRNGGLYADCLHTSGEVGVDEGELYDELYPRLCLKVLGILRRWYDEGRIVDPEQSLVKKWNLEPISTAGGTTIYKPVDDWGMKRVTVGNLLDIPISALLYELSKGRERSVSIRVGVNLVDYHEIAKRLFTHMDYHFSNGQLHFTPKSVQDLLRVVDGVYDILYGDQPQSRAVATLSASRLSWIRIYSLIVQRSITNDTAVYVRRDNEPLFIFSFAVSPISNTDALKGEVLLRARRTFAYLHDRMVKPGSLEPLDIHSLLDDPNVDLPEDLSSPTVRSYLEKQSDVQF